jgi:hypothetical protein
VTRSRNPEAAIRLRINYTAWDSDPSILVAIARLRNTYPFFGNDLVRTGAAGEFITDIFHHMANNPTWESAWIHSNRDVTGGRALLPLR